MKPYLWVSLCIFRGPVEYSAGPKAPKICQMTFNKHFDEKIITIRCVVLEISYFEKSLEIEVITPFTAIGRNMNRKTAKKNGETFFFFFCGI